MVLPIGFFMPLPLAMMIPFMGIQSAVMAKQFGENFQFGKRRISAMSNEEFNRLTPKILMENANAELKSMIPSMEQSIKDMSEFQTFLIGEFIRMIGDLLAAGLGKVLGLDEKGVDDSLTAIEHFIHGHPSGHKTTVQPIPKGPDIQQPFDPRNPTPFTPRIPKVDTNRGVTQQDVSIKGLPMAGQTQKIVRDRLIQQINAVVKALTTGNQFMNQTTKNIKKAKMAKLQLELTNLLARYNWR